VAVVGGEDVLPALLVEVARAHVVVQDLLGHVDLLLRHHRAAQIPLDEILQTEEADVVKLAAAALKVLRIIAVRGAWGGRRVSTASG
jgi:hypothetical protein